MVNINTRGTLRSIFKILLRQAGLHTHTHTRTLRWTETVHTDCGFLLVGPHCSMLSVAGMEPGHSPHLCVQYLYLHAFRTVGRGPKASQVSLNSRVICQWPCTSSPSSSHPHAAFSCFYPPLNSPSLPTPPLGRAVETEVFRFLQSAQAEGEGSDYRPGDLRASLCNTTEAARLWRGGCVAALFCGGGSEEVSCGAAARCSVSVWQRCDSVMVCLCLHLDSCKPLTLVDHMMQLWWKGLEVVSQYSAGDFPPFRVFFWGVWNC